MNYVKNGGRILCLVPNDDLLKALDLDQYMKLVKIDPKSGVFINRARQENSLFDGLPNDVGLAYWNDYTDWDESKPGYPLVAPVNVSLRLNNPNTLENVAVLANFGRGLADVALAQVFCGNGSVVVSGFDFWPRLGNDPLADRFLCNLISYDSLKKKHNKYPVVGQKILWGNFQSEKGIASMPECGLLLSGEPSQRNMEGPNGPEYLINGRRIAGPFMFNSNGEVFFIGGDAGAAQFFATLPRNYRSMVSTILNPTNVPQEISIQINGMTPQIFEIGPSEIGDCSVQLPVNADDIRVIFRGRRDLVLQQTRFE